MKLPNEYDNPDSEFFVPDELRQIYEALPDVPSQSNPVLLQRYAAIKASQIVPAESATGEFWETRDAIEAAYDIEAAKHLHFLMTAQKRYSVAQKNKERELRERAASICDICGEATYRQAENPLQRRSLSFSKVTGVKQPNELTSCLKCYHTALKVLTERAAKEAFGRKTREQLVAEALT